MVLARGTLWSNVALKILPQASARDAERMARFEREARVLLSFSNDHVIQLPWEPQDR